jgi:hypothetical protein
VELFLVANTERPTREAIEADVGRGQAAFLFL